jgi:hypothetical protein
MNRRRFSNPRNAVLAVAAIFVILADGASAQQKLGDLVTEGGFEWLIGDWVATTDEGGKIHSFYKWGLNKNLITMGFKMGDFEGRGMIYYVPAENIGYPAISVKTNIADPPSFGGINSKYRSQRSAVFWWNQYRRSACGGINY